MTLFLFLGSKSIFSLKNQQKNTSIKLLKILAFLYPKYVITPSSTIANILVFDRSWILVAEFIFVSQCFWPFSKEYIIRYQVWVTKNGKEESEPINDKKGLDIDISIFYSFNCWRKEQYLFFRILKEMRMFGTFW